MFHCTVAVSVDEKDKVTGNTSGVVPESPSGTDSLVTWICGVKGTKCSVIETAVPAMSLYSAAAITHGAVGSAQSTVRPSAGTLMKRSTDQVVLMLPEPSTVKSEPVPLLQLLIDDGWSATP